MEQKKGKEIGKVKWEKEAIFGKDEPQTAQPLPESQPQTANVKEPVNEPLEQTKQEYDPEAEIRALVVREAKTSTTALMNPIEYQQMKWIAKDLMVSGAMPSGYANENQILMAIMAGREMGMKPIEAINGLYFVNGGINIWGKSVTRRLREHGYIIQYIEETDSSCTALIKKGKEEYSETYKYQDALDSGYTTDRYGKEKFGWKKGINRKLKLRYGVLNLIIKTYLPEVLGSAQGIVEVEKDFEPAIKLDPKERKVIVNGDLAEAIKNGGENAKKI